MLVVGIDPGTAFVGIAWIRRHHHHRISRHTSYFKCDGRWPYRFIEMRNRLEKFLSGIPEPPTMVAIEEPDRGTSTKPVNPRVETDLRAVYAVCVAEVGRQFTQTNLIPVRYESWTGGLQKADVYLRLSKKYDKPKFNRDDEADALGIADFAFEIAKKVPEKTICL